MRLHRVLALATLCVAAPMAFAQTTATSTTEIERRLTADGYKVVEIERYERTIEVRAFEPGGACVELHLNPTSGEIVHRESDNRCNGRDGGRHGGRGGDDHGRHGGGHH